ncbi:glycosyl transferase family 2 [Bacteroidia bacterium]|nr:glycosyl transferase family 2 [Bacteroidia bacterium]GHT83446.1 glycosyl transferase family 2 [Bacteroidia bacterium]
MLSIIICTYNRDKFLEMCLQSIPTILAEKQSFEVIVVDNNCTDRTAAICRVFCAQHPDVSFLRVEEAQQGLGFARNKGIATARGELLSFIDDDAEVTPNFVAAIIEAFACHPEYSSLGGRVLPVFEGGRMPEWFNKYLNGPVSKIDFGDKPRPFPKKYPVGCNMAFRRGVFEKYGGFNGQLSRSDDKDMFLRLKQGEEKVWYAPEVTVYHNIPYDRMTFEAIMRIGFSNGKFETIRLAQDSNSQKIRKAVELMFKFSASLFIGLGFCLCGQRQKCRYLIAYMYKMLLGYVRHIHL